MHSQSRETYYDVTPLSSYWFRNNNTECSSGPDYFQANTHNPFARPEVSSPGLQTRAKEEMENLEREKGNGGEDALALEQTIHNLQVNLKNVERQLETERNNHEQTKLDLVEKQKDATNQRQLMLDAVGELNRLLRGNEVRNQLTDDEIVQKAMTLRVGIRDFALRNFASDIGQSRIVEESLESLNKFLRMPPDLLLKYVSTSSTRISVMRAFLWSYIRESVFNQFFWTWQGAGAAFRDMCGSLDSLRHDKNAGLQGMRKFHTWRANTASLLVEAMSLDEAEADIDCQTLVRQWSIHISQILEPFGSSGSREYQDGLESILIQSLELDKDTCRQVASIEWLAPNDFPFTFLREEMELESRQEKQNEHMAVTMVLGPGLVKYGKSSGDRFDTMERLLKTQVFCDMSERHGRQ
ncbi:hypothetical protein F5B22DRAFT_512713 [Xylaria bambusicola]|uniref:uncharacterized protein n=1 Tax=Xylaria bambusicola TaxID=326684 RepID=UPI0020089144|nr:uncharacterized protein F5B22DRAFT_512713 [Xylaria bambusicola]KAI0521985.1 hypothetical protein F5B22DRAFT_512713 [Xylaria bambusicola]